MIIRITKKLCKKYTKIGIWKYEKSFIKVTLWLLVFPIASWEIEIEWKKGI